MKKMITAVMGEFLINQCIAFLPHGIDALFIAIFQFDDLQWRQALGSDFVVTFPVAIESQM